MAYEKLYALLQKICQKTKEGKIDWKKIDADGRFQAAFSGASVMISHEAVGEEGSLTYVFRVLDKKGRTIESATYPQLAHTIGIESYDLLSQTYDAARRQATGEDEAIDSLMKDLGD